MIRIRRQRRATPPHNRLPRINPHVPDSHPEQLLSSMDEVSSNPLRKNPRKERGQRLRRELRTTQMMTAAGNNQQSALKRDPIIVSDDVPWIIAVSLYEEAWADAERQVLGAARRLADEISGGVVLVRLGERVANMDASELGVDRLVQLPTSIDSDIIAAKLKSVVSKFSPAHILFAEAGVDADVARRLALELNDRPATGLQQLSKEQGIVLEASGNIQISRVLPKVLTLSSDRFDPIGDVPLREARLVTIEQADDDGSLTDLGVVTTSQLDAPLSEARFLVSAGDGVTDWTAFHDVAEALGGTIAGSRQVCDAGHLPRNRQVGASGTIVEARCYLAFGISGAPQHLQGVQRCRYVIAVNTDLHAAMVKRADLAIIADAQAVMPALTRLIRGETND